MDDREYACVCMCDSKLVERPSLVAATAAPVPPRLTLDENVRLLVLLPPLVRRHDRDLCVLAADALVFLHREVGVRARAPHHERRVRPGQPELDAAGGGRAVLLGKRLGLQQPQAAALVLLLLVLVAGRHQASRRLQHRSGAAWGSVAPDARPPARPPTHPPTQAIVPPCYR